jgi:phosphate uptake regulator
MSATNMEPLSPEQMATHLRERTLDACQLARKASGIVAEGIATGVASLLDGVRQHEKELDALDREIDQGVTRIITKVSEQSARELLACMKFIISLERIGDLLLNCSNRAAAVGGKIELQDVRDLTMMASRL